MTFDLETGAHYCPCGEKPSNTNFDVSRTFRSRVIGQHLSDESRDLATLTFDLGGQELIDDAGLRILAYQGWSSYIGIPVRKILGIYYVSIKRLGDLDL